MERYGILLFYQTKDAMKAEDLAKARRLQARLIPTPARIYASCGFSLKYDLTEEAALLKELQDERLICEAVYHAEREGLFVSYDCVRR